MKIFDQYGIPRDISHLRAVERLDNLKKTSNSPWPVIEECFKIWEDTHPREWKAYLVEVQGMRDTRLDKEFGESDKRKDSRGMTMRYTLDIPEKVMKMIRLIYTPNELPMDRKFFQEWGRRFPKTRVAEKQ